MFDKFKNLFGVAPPDGETPATLRLRAMADELGEPDHIDLDDDPAFRINIYAFGRNFIEECDTDGGDREGFVLVTSGMSDRLMTTPDNADVAETMATELVWYVPDLSPAFFTTLRWLAKLPEMDRTWFGHGHTVPMPAPPLEGCPFQTFLLLPPVIRTDRELFEHIDQSGHEIGTLSVHLISPSEYALVRNNEEGLGEFLNLLDANDYPHVFDAARPSYIPLSD
jgi:hypothetical protein